MDLHTEVNIINSGTKKKRKFWPEKRKLEQSKK